MLIACMWWSYLCSKARSNAELGVVGFKVELGAGWREGSWYFLVEIVEVTLELALALRSDEVEWKSFIILHYLSLISCEPPVLMLVHEISIPSLVPEHTEVLQQFQWIHFWYSWLPSLRGNIRIVVVVDMTSPLSLQLKPFNVSLGSSLVSDVLWYEESWSCAIYPAETFPSTGFKYPMIGMETELMGNNLSRATCSKKTLRRKCLSIWRRRSSGVWLLEWYESLLSEEINLETHF